MLHWDCTTTTRSDPQPPSSETAFLKRAVPVLMRTTSAEHAEILLGDSGKPFVEYAVHVDDPGELSPLLVSIKGFSSEDRRSDRVLT
jgi:hypothetical protein